MWNKIKPEECQDNVFSLIGREWMLVTAGNEEKANSMTASWGGFGIMWGKPVVYVVIRPQRYTKEFIDREERFSLNFLPEEYRKVLNYMGTVSGREEDKIAAGALHVQMLDNTPAFEESRMVMVCKKLFAQDMKADSFVEGDIIEKWYLEKDFHTLYIAQLEQVYIK